MKSGSDLRYVWSNMRQRCTNPKATQFKDYGGRGIKVCAAWDNYATFERDMSPRPPGMTLDRIDGNGDYSLGNCRWASRKEQQRNRRVNVYITIEGESYLAIDLAERAGHSVATIIERAKAGLPMPEIVAHERRWSYNPEAIARGSITANANRRAKTHCKHGHEWTTENTRIISSGRAAGTRECRECSRVKVRLFRAAKATAAHLSAPTQP